VKTAVEELSPTKVRLSVEVPFSELKPSLDKAYKEVGRQVRIPGFRPGRVPPQIIDQRVGRGAVLEQALNEAVPELYSKAVTENDLRVLGQPELDVTKLEDGDELVFTAEVEVRPQFDLPDLTALTVTVDNSVVGPDEVEEYLNQLRERFASLKTVQRAAESGDFTSIDLSATVDGNPVEDAQASGISYEVGSGSVMEGLDEAITGLSAGESTTFRGELAGGDSAGEEADVTVTVHSVKVKELPELDDSFAQLASEFDTLGEFRAATRAQLERMQAARQAQQARDRSLDALLAAVDIPLPEGFVAHELEHANESVTDQLQRGGVTLPEYLESVGQSEDEFRTELEEQSRRTVKAGLVLDEVARADDLNVNQQDLEYYITEQAARYGVSPDALAKQLIDSGSLNAAAGEVLRGKALSVVAEKVKVVDDAGNEIDIKSVLESFSGDSSAESSDDDSDSDSEDDTEAPEPAEAVVTAEVTDEDDDSVESEA
jgi:trigger factor